MANNLWISSVNGGIDSSINIPAKTVAAVPSASNTGEIYYDIPRSLECPRTSSKRLTLKNPSISESGGSLSEVKVAQELSGSRVKNTPVMKAPVFLNHENAVTTCRKVQSAMAAEYEPSNCGGIVSPSASLTVPPRPFEDVSISVQSRMAPSTSGLISTPGNKNAENNEQVSNPASTATGETSNAGEVATGNTVVSKKRKPRLTVNLPSSSNSSGGSRQMSPSEGRELDELMLMARQLAASSSTTCGSSPTESISSGSSKESPKSPSDGPSPPLSFFFSGLRRRRSVDKKTFVDGLKTTTLSVDVVHQTFGTDEQAAFNQLVASNSPPPPATEGDSVPLEGPSTRRKGFELRHLHQEIESSSTRHPLPVEGHRHRQLNTLPESHQEEISELVVWPLVPEHVSSSSMPKVESKRSLSESERSAPFDEFRAESTSSTATSVAKLSSANSVPDKGYHRSMKVVPELPSAVASDLNCPPRPPPPLPPWIPIRPSTVNKTLNRRRNKRLSSSSTPSKTALTIDCNKRLQQLPHFH